MAVSLARLTARWKRRMRALGLTKPGLSVRGGVLPSLRGWAAGGSQAASRGSPGHQHRDLAVAPDRLSTALDGPVVGGGVGHVVARPLGDPRQLRTGRLAQSVRRAPGSVPPACRYGSLPALASVAITTTRPAAQHRRTPKSADAAAESVRVWRPDWLASQRV